MKRQAKDEPIRYKIYPSLLDAFQDYLDAEENWSLYYGNSDSPSVSLDDFEDKQYKSLIDRINRVPFESEAADRGTAFNEIVDCLIENRNSKKMELKRIYGDMDNPSRVTAVSAKYKGKTYSFPLELCKDFAEYYEGALTQVFVIANLNTSYGNVQLYGYVDELMPFCIHDIKTTGMYFHGKFRKHWQHIVYPYCLIKKGTDIRAFEYNITDFKETYTERYDFLPERDIPKLRAHCEHFIEFLEANRSKITDKKIFNQK